MGRTEKAGDRRLKRFERNRLLPLMDRLTREGGGDFALAPDPAATTYFTDRRERDRARGGDWPLMEYAQPQVARRLEELWLSEGRDDLVALAVDLGRLSEALHTTDERSEEVSPFIYEMF